VENSSLARKVLPICLEDLGSQEGKRSSKVFNPAIKASLGMIINWNSSLTVAPGPAWKPRWLAEWQIACG